MLQGGYTRRQFLNSGPDGGDFRILPAFTALELDNLWPAPAENFTCISKTTTGVEAERLHGVLTLAAHRKIVSDPERA